jgi:hypothetical protein
MIIAEASLFAPKLPRLAQMGKTSAWAGLYPAKEAIIIIRL